MGGGPAREGLLGSIFGGLPGGVLFWGPRRGGGLGGFFHMEENIKKTKRTMKKMGDGLKSLGNTFGSMFGKKKDAILERLFKLMYEANNKDNLGT